jgi:hypothetical protein
LSTRKEGNSILKFNSYRAQRYLRSKFVEGTFLLASEASDIELEVLTTLRNVVKQTIGDVALGDAWKVQKLANDQLLIKPGEMWFQGLPFNFRSGKDHLVSGAILSAGILPIGVTVTDDTSGLGKVIKFNDGATTPTNSYKIVITAKEELITDVDDAFLQNANLTETTAQKIRLVLQLNIVPDTAQTESPVPYADEDFVSASVTDFPSAGGYSAPNLVNQIVVTPTSGGNGELLALNLIPGAEKIDGRDLELVLRNDTSLGGGHPLPKSINEQAAFANGTLIDSTGTSYHVNAIFNDVVSTQVVIRIDKEPGQVDPVITNTIPFTLVKREVFVTDDVNGLPQGKLHVGLATVNWSSTGLIKHESSIVDLRKSVIKYADYEIYINNKDGLRLTDGGNVAWNLATQKISWASDFTLVNPHGTNMSMAASSTPIVEGGTIAYDLDLTNGGSIQRGTLAANVTSFGAISSLSAINLSSVKIGNIIVDSANTVAEIVAIDDVANTITVSPSLTANGSATIYLDSFGPGTAPLSEKTYVLAVRKSNKVFVGYDDTGLSDGESTQIGQGISNQNLIFIGATGDADYSPVYSTNHYVTNGDSLVTAIGKLDSSSYGKADRNLGNLTSPTVINQDLNPDAFSDAANRSIGSIYANLKPDITSYTITGTFTSGSNQITSIVGALPTRKAAYYYAVSAPSNVNITVITNFNSSTVITMLDTASVSGTSVSITLVPILGINTDDISIAGKPSSSILHRTGNTASARSGDQVWWTGDSASGDSGGFQFKSGSASGIRGSVGFDVTSIIPSNDLTVDLGTLTNRWSTMTGDVVSATSQFGLRDVTGNPILNGFLLSGILGIYNGPFISGPHFNTGSTYNAFGFRGRNYATGNSHSIVNVTGNASAGNSGDIVQKTGTASGTRGQYKIDARQVDVTNTEIVNVNTTVNSAATTATNKAYVDSCGGATSIVSTGGTTTLSSISPRFMSITGTLGQFVKLPSTAGLQVGEIFGINYNGTAGQVTIQDSTGSVLLTIGPDTVAFCTVMSTGSQSWNTYFVIEGGSYLEIRKTLGQNLPALTPVYISEGAPDGGRTASQIYQLDETNDSRMEFVGFTTSTDVAGNEVKVQTSGVLSGTFVGLTPGKPVYWYGGAISQTIPTTNNTWQITVGKAISSTQILINPDLASSAIFITDASGTDTILNNQSTDLAISGLVFDGSIYRSFVIEYYVYRTAGVLGESAESGQIRGIYKTVIPGWQISVGGIAGNAGVNFNITTSGQITYTSDNLVGAGYTGKISYTIVNQIGV